MRITPLPRQVELWGPADRWLRRWQVTSFSGSGTYVVARDADGRWGCSCPAWIYDGERRPCKHIEALREDLGRDRSRLSSSDAAEPSGDPG